MKPGLELDKLIAEKIFNMIECDEWEPTSLGSAGGLVLMKNCNHENCWPKHKGENIHGIIGGCPRYSTCPSTNKILLDRMLEQMPHKDIHIEHLDGYGWSVSTCFEDEGWSDWAQGETLEHAICIAALLLFKIDVDLTAWIRE